MSYTFLFVKKSTRVVDKNRHTHVFNFFFLICVKKLERHLFENMLVITNLIESLVISSFMKLNVRDSRG